MRNEDNDCIRYLMKEMDPSEELLMERAMMEDEDLLIEVESMRQTLHKLDKLPEVEPPSDVTDSIMQKAAEQAEKNRKSQNKLTPVFKYAVAATLALTVTAGGTWFYMGLGDEDPQVAADQTQSAASTAVTSGVASGAQESDMQNVQFAGTNQGQGDQSATVSPQNSNVEPWIDRNQILRFEDKFSDQDSDFHTLFKNATQKLQPIEEFSPAQNRVNPLQLTGSGN